MMRRRDSSRVRARARARGDARRHVDAHRSDSSPIRHRRASSSSNERPAPAVAPHTADDCVDAAPREVGPSARIEGRARDAPKRGLRVARVDAARDRIDRIDRIDRSNRIESNRIDRSTRDGSRKTAHRRAPRARRSTSRRRRSASDVQRDVRAVGDDDDVVRREGRDGAIAKGANDRPTRPTRDARANSFERRARERRWGGVPIGARHRRANERDGSGCARRWGRARRRSRRLR